MTELPNVDCTLDGIKLALDRQLYPSVSTKLAEGQTRKPRGHLVALSLSQVEALIKLAEAGDYQKGYQAGYMKGEADGYVKRDHEVKAALA